MKIKTTVLFVVCAIVGLGNAQDHRIEQTFVSPNGTESAALAAQDSSVRPDLPPIYSLGTYSNGSFTPFTDLPHPIYRREYHGTSWFQGSHPRWIDDQFLIFEDESGLAIADVRNRRMLLNHVFEGYEKSPVADKWAAIRYRATGRHQESLDADFQDMVLVIDPYEVASRIANATEENFVGQMKAVNPGGIVLAKPHWAPNGSTFAILTWNRGAVQAVRYDTTLRETARSAVKMQIDRDSALSTGLNEDLAPVAAGILSDPTTFR